mmetsp:Transcript_16710/g.2726  ORF Transcript_16710/g.2726 Transcript_16710/m.2726 type:complete len:138 (+) Transcript_16710:76-489(+)
MQRSDSRPHKIIEGLYLGSVGAAYTYSSIKNFKISHILTVCDGLPPKFPNEFEYTVIRILDEPNARLSAHFRECVDLIHNILSQHRNILVHCFAGVSRSATIVIAYLMRYKGMVLRDAILHVRSRRPWINPNPGFMN